MQENVGATLSPDGLASGVRYIASPNCDERPKNSAITLVVIHSISLPPGIYTGDSVEDFFMNRLDVNTHPYFATIADLKVSAHFFIRRTGLLLQFVPCSFRAWHAGASNWCGKNACNDFSIGIELEGTDESPFEPVQYMHLAQLIKLLHLHYPIKDLAGHSDISPHRKTDPGLKFSWVKLHAALANPFPAYDFQHNSSRRQSHIE